MESLDVISVPPTSGNPPKGILVALHGWGANAQDLVTLAPFLQLPDYQLFFPNAPFPHPHAPGGRAWYALERQDYVGLEDSRQRLREWLLSLEGSTGIPLSKTILGGFSQGGAMTLDVGLGLPLAGLCSLSGYLHSEPKTENNSFPPILIIHGRQDMVVRLQAAQKARDILTGLGASVEYAEFDMGHEVSPVVLNVMQRFILSLTSSPA